MATAPTPRRSLPGPPGAWILAAAILAVPVPAQPAGTAPAGIRALCVSDLHFDPFRDGSVVKRLVQAPVGDWQAILESSPEPPPPRLGTDSPWTLLESTLQQMAEAEPRPDLIVVSGDYITHDFARSLHDLAGIDDPDVVRDFLRKTVAHVTARLEARFPGTPVYPALGNNDAYCGDYNLQPAGPFLRDAAALWRDRVQLRARSTTFDETFPRLGSYVVEHPGSLSCRLIVVNTTFLSRRYENRCGDATEDPAGDQLSWLEEQLVAARKADQKAWLVAHIPPGVDLHQTLSTTPPVILWQKAPLARFLDLVARHADTILGCLAGHIHRDSFRLLRDTKGAPATYVHIGPSISPIFYNDPGFERLTFDPGTAQLQDFTVYRLDLPLPAGEEEEGGEPAAQWAREYSFSDTYGGPGVTVARLAALWHDLETGKAARDEYLEHYAVGLPVEPMSEELWRAYWCVMGHLRAAEFQACREEP